MEKFLLSNGITVLVENMPFLRSVSIGVWIRTGSIMETPEENGLSHFMEHMAFKGNEGRSARRLAEEMDEIGGMMNAATGKLCTDYYAKVIDEDLPRTVDMLADMICRPLLDAEEMERERGVILEEIAMCEDSPEDMVFDVLSEAVYGTQTLGQTILGPEERIRMYTPEHLWAYRKKHYSPKNAVIAIAGNVSREGVEALLNEKFGLWQGDAHDEYPAAVAVDVPRRLAREKDTEQVHIAFSCRTEAMESEQRYPLAVLSGLFGGGMSSRLFQRIREELGMAYSVYTSTALYPSCGEFSVYAATSPRHAKRVIEEMHREMDKIVRDGIQEREFVQAKAQLRVGSILGLESAYNHMNSMGQSMAVTGRVQSPEEALKKLESVTKEDVERTAREVLLSPRAYAVLGKHAEKYLPYIPD